MARQYIAEHVNGRNHDPITSGSPRGVWNQLQKATGRDRKWLQDYGWRVKLDDGVRPPAPRMNPLELDELELTPLMEVKTTQRKPGWILVAGIVCVLIWVALYYFWIR